MLTLLHTLGSPFARKVRIVLEEKGLEYEKDIQSASKRPLEIFSAQNPSLTIPVLIDGETTIFESNLIVEYLLTTYPGNAPGSPKPPLAATLTRPDHRWEDAKTLAVLESMANTMVNMRFYSASGVDVKDVAYGRRQQRRFNACLDWLEKRATAEGFIPGVFSLQDIGLICPLGYLDARGEYLEGVLEWRGRPNIEAIVARWQDRPSVKSTVPGAASGGAYSAVE
jgi:glutathione S-transferase